MCFRSTAARLRFDLEDGLAVIVHGRVELYQPRGKYQVVVDTIEPKGAGALQLAFEKLKARLAQEGLFDEARKRPLPSRVSVLGIVTSPAGAAIHDILRTFRLERAGIRVLLWPSQVQGEGAADQIAEGIRMLNQDGRPEAIIVGRGGGSIEDLWCFNEEAVARAIAASAIPIISAVGHEMDFTIADFTADFRAATPTAAARAVARGWEESRLRLASAAGELGRGAERELLDREQRLSDLVRHRGFERTRARAGEAGRRADRAVARATELVRDRVREATGEWSRLSDSLVRLHPIARVLRQQSLVRSLAGRLGSTVQGTVAARRVRYETGGARLHALSPLASLGRGFAICRRADRTLVSRVAQVRPGDAVTVQVSDGEFGCAVSRVGSNTKESTR